MCMEIMLFTRQRPQAMWKWPRSCWILIENSIAAQQMMDRKTGIVLTSYSKSWTIEEKLHSSGLLHLAEPKWWGFCVLKLRTGMFIVGDTIQPPFFILRSLANTLVFLSLNLGNFVFIILWCSSRINIYMFLGKACSFKFLFFQLMQKQHRNWQYGMHTFRGRWMRMACHVFNCLLACHLLSRVDIPWECCRNFFIFVCLQLLLWFSMVSLSPRQLL